MKYLKRFIIDKPLLSSIVIHFLIFLVIYLTYMKSEIKNFQQDKNMDVSVEFISHKESNPEDKKNILDNIQKITEESILHSEKMIELDNEINQESDMENFIKNKTNESHNLKINEEYLTETNNQEIEDNIYEIMSLEDIERNLGLFELFAKNKTSEYKNDNELNDKEIYIAKIQQEIYSKWNSEHLDLGLNCDLVITQDREGYIKNFRVLNCDNEKIRDSAIKTISSIKRLPYQEDFSIFSNTIRISFISN